MANLANDEIARFYDEFGQRMINDYVLGNARVSKAIERVCRYVTPDVKSLLDLGCGIGISSAELSRRFPQLRVRGVDISPENMRVAKSLFANAMLDFQVSTITDGAVQGTYDIIALIDAYEHVPLGSRGEVHAQLRRLLSPHGTVVITVPSPLHQAELHEHHPEKLQIVDETITIDDALKLSQELGGELVCFEYISVWKMNDYLHIVIQREPQYAPIPQAARGRWRKISRHASDFWRRWHRSNHVRKSLGIHVPLRNRLPRG